MTRFLAAAVLSMLAVVSTGAQPSVGQGRATVDVVIAGMGCKQIARDQLDCEYRVGRDLHFTISGVGDEDADVTFMKSSFDGDYYGSVALAYRCAIVKPGGANRLKLLDAGALAFVSPKNGKVYADWQSCKAAR